MLKKIIYLFWIISVVGIMAYFSMNPDDFSPESIAEFSASFQTQLLAIYLVISLLRGLFLVPFTPFFIGGLLLFPTQIPLVLFISIAGILLSSTTIYYFSDFLGFSGQLEKRFPKHLSVWKKRLSHPKAIFYVVSCSFVPIFSNELICYVAGIVKMPFVYLISGVFIGSLLLCSLYLCFGITMTNILTK